MFLSFVDEQTLNQFIQLFLLQSNSSSLRWQAHKLLHTLYQYSQSTEQVQLIDQLWKLWSSMPTYGQKATQFVDLLGFMTISTPQVLEKVQNMLIHIVKLHLCIILCVLYMFEYSWLEISSSKKCCTYGAVMRRNFCLNCTLWRLRNIYTQISEHHSKTFPVYDMQTYV